jgi:SRSO17 transposase
MGRTITPGLASEVLERLHGYALEFRPLFPRSDQFRQGRLYLHGLLLDGERKSIEPLSRRVPGGNEQNLQQFVNQSPWDPAPVLRAYRARLAAACATDDGVIVVDDTGFPKQGRHSVGVARQYSGTLGKRANCQVATSLHYAGARGDYPLALRLYLPEAWADDAERLERARVPPEGRGFRTKWRIALDLLDMVRAEGLPHAVVVADAGYGVATEFRDGLDERRERYIVGVSGEEVALREPPRWQQPTAAGRRGRPFTRAYLAADGPRPEAIRALAESLERTAVCWRPGTRGPLEAEFAWVRVWPARRWQAGLPGEALPDAEAAARWLLVEWRKDGTVKYALSNLPSDTPLRRAVGWWKERWQVERGYEQLKGELGLDHFEGRSWPGFHHHAALAFLAYGFLALERLRALQTTESPAADGPPPGEAPRGA